MPFDITKEATGEGAARHTVPVVGANNDIALSRITGGSVADVADANTIPAILVGHRIAIADGTTADIDTTLDFNERVIDVHLVKTGAAGGASDTIQIKNGATAITNAMSINVADQTVVRAGTIDDAAHEIVAGGTLRVSRVKSSAANVACIVYVTCLRVVA